MLRTAALALSLLALLPAASHAATLSLDEAGTIHYTAEDGEANRLSMNVVDVGYAVIKDEADPDQAACGTIWTHPGWRACPNGRRPQVTLGDGDDEANLADGGTEETGLFIGSATVEAGPGDDNVITGWSGDDLDGGDGNDTLKPFGGANRVDGGAGDDTLESFYGDDIKIGGPGADTFAGHDGAETIHAHDGAGTDKVTCGGGYDIVVADAGDSVSTDCEQVTRHGGEQPGGGGGDKPREEQPGGDRPGGEQPGGETPRPDVPAGPVVPSGPVVPAADRTAPKLTVKVKRRHGRTVLTVRADESVLLRGAGRARNLAAGTPVRIVRRGKVKRLRLVAIDAAGNQTVKRVRA